MPAPANLYSPICTPTLCRYSYEGLSEDMHTWFFLYDEKVAAKHEAEGQRQVSCTAQNLGWCSAVQCNVVQCSSVQCSAVQCSAVQCSATP